MKKKNVNLEFYVFNITYENKLYRANIISDDLIERIYKNVKNGSITTFAELRKEIRYYFMKYWSRVQFEFMISGVFENMKSVMERENRDYSVGKKIDVFYQIEKNLNTITELIIHKMELPIEIPSIYPEDKDFWEKGNVKSDSLNF